MDSKGPWGEPLLTAVVFDMCLPTLITRLLSGSLIQLCVSILVTAASPPGDAVACLLKDELKLIKGSVPDGPE